MIEIKDKKFKDQEQQASDNLSKLLNPINKYQRQQKAIMRKVGELKNGNR